LVSTLVNARYAGQWELLCASFFVVIARTKWRKSLCAQAIAFPISYHATGAPVGRTFSMKMYEVRTDMDTTPLAKLIVAMYDTLGRNSMIKNQRSIAPLRFPFGNYRYAWQLYTAFHFQYERSH
jgi:hypothetical protein